MLSAGQRTAAITLVLLLAAALRLHALAQPVTLHPDEALFSTFARAAALNGDWLLPGPLDKPPLALYASALAQVFAGEGVLAARLPGALAGIVLVAAIYGLARRLYGGAGVPLLAALLAAFSPLAISYSASAFTDALMLPLAALALLAGAGGRWLACGLLLGLAVASKHQAIYYAPLCLALGWAADRLTGRGLLRFGAGLGAALAALALWDSARGDTSTFTLAAANNDPWRLLRANEVAPRLAAWLGHGAQLFGPASAALLPLALAAVGARVLRQPRRQASLADVLLVTFTLAYMLLHWLIAFNPYERYLLPLLPPVCLLVARGLAGAAEALRLPSWGRAAAVAALMLALLPAALGAAAGQSPLDAERARYNGIETLAAWLNAKPVATVIYDRWLGWELGYYLGQWHDKRRVYYPTPEALAAGARALREAGTRYLVAPADQPVALWLAALREAGFTVTADLRLPRFVVYALRPPPD
jgi:4-amino-4-deoxy-L-arabinose transferase-like glycosyltransferase